MKRLGGDVAAIYPAGGATGQLLRRLMDREGVRSLAIPASEETREDFTVFEETTKQQYRFVMPGAPLSEPEWQECLRRAWRTPNLGRIFVVASGSLPPGVPEDFYGRVARVAKEIGAKVIVDTSGPPLKAALKEGVYLIKPNLREFQELTGTSSADDAALIEAGRGLIDRGLVEFIALSLGPHGALLIARDRALRADGLPIKPASVVGAGDSFVGAMVWSLAQDNSLDAALQIRSCRRIGGAAQSRNGTLRARGCKAPGSTSDVTVTARPAHVVTPASRPDEQARILLRRPS